MRKILFFCFLLFSSLLFANPVTNVRAMQEGKKIVLLYDISESAYVADVEIRVDGASRMLPLNTLSGDVGREVEAGRDRRIEYDVLLDYVDGLRSDNISFVIMLGAQAVDLGLSVKWASCNVGANSPEEYGDYFAWGEVKPKSVYDWYDWTTYKYCNGSYKKLTKYNSDSRYGRVDNKSTLEAQDDAATVNWGSNWRMPTKEEQDELRTKCKWEWTKLNGVNGYKVIGPNGNSIFLPAAGCMYGGALSNAGSRGYYWSSSLYAVNPSSAYYVYFYSGGVNWYSYGRCYGFTVRPVCIKKQEIVESRFKVGDEIVHQEESKYQTTQHITPSENELSKVKEVIHVVEKGETLFSISKKYNVAIYDLVKLNPELKNGLRIGVSIIIKKNIDKSVNGEDVIHEYVDLGLSVKWATCNVGANSPEEFGDYFAWGEVKPKSVYDWSTYKYCNGSAITLTKYNSYRSYGRVDNKSTLEAQDDAATVNWGGAWRMPTIEETRELCTKCKLVWTTLNGVNGYKVIGPNGNSIFLPAAGGMVGGTLKRVGSYGDYWSSSFHTDHPYYAFYVYFDSDYMSWLNYGNRYYGHSIRPVCQ